MSRRGQRRGGPRVVTIFWRDIPAQVTATGPDEATEKVLLDHRFQMAIDRAATIAGLTDTQSYVNEWRRESCVAHDDPITAARSRAERLDTTYSRERLEALVANGGLGPTTTGDTPQ